MYSLLQKKVYQFFIFFIVLSVLSLGLVFIGGSSASEAASEDSTLEDFYSFEQEYLDYINSEEDASNEVRLFSLESEQQTRFYYKRLIVIGDYTNSYGAKKVIDGYKNYTILCYDSEEATEHAYNMLSQDENINVMVDEVLTLDDYADNNYEYTSTTITWGKNSTNAGGIIDYLSTNGTNEEVVVVVIDSGIRPTHVYFQDRILEDDGNYVAYSYVNPDVAYTYNFEDDNGHGSHVSGIVTTLTPSNVKILPIKVFNSTGECSFSTIIYALERVIEVYSESYNIACVNLSLGGNTSSSVSATLNNLIGQLKDKNILTVVSAGNEQMDTSNFMPSNCEEAITVSALKQNDDGTVEFDNSYSNFGDAVDISAPGTLIYSAYYQADNLAAQLTGTSMAAPHVSAAVALLCCDEKYWDGVNYTYTADEIEARLYKNTVDLGDSGWDKFYGNGSLDLRYFNVENQTDVLTFKSGNQVLNVDDYIEFTDSFSLTVEASESDYQIFYTTDGSVPTRYSTRYTGTLNVTNSSVYNFIAIKLVNGSTVASSVVYKVDLFNPNDDIDSFFVNDSGTLTDYTGHFTSLEIPRVVDGLLVLELDTRLFSDSEIENLILPSTCQEIGAYAFSNCYNLESISFSGVTNIMPYAFENCSSLSQINLDSVQYLGQKIIDVEVNGHVFEGCTSLKDVYLPKLAIIGEDVFDNSGVTMVAIGKSFTQCYNTPIKRDITIYGYAGSKAEEYCDKFGNAFVAIDAVSITSDLPSSLQVKKNTIEVLSVEAVGLKLSYQWYQTESDTASGIAIAQETDSSFTIDSSQVGTKKYYVKVTDWEGNAVYSSICEVGVTENEETIVAQKYEQNSWIYYSSLENAINDSQDGDVIVLVQNAIVSDFIAIDNDLTILSKGDNYILYDSAIMQTSFQLDKPLIEVASGVTLNIGLEQSTYQSLRLGKLYIDGQLENISTLFSLANNSSLNMYNSYIQLFTANRLVEGASDSSLTIKSGGILNNINSSSQEEYLFYAQNLTLSGDAIISDNYVTGGYLFYLENSSLKITDNVTFTNNEAKFLLSTYYDANLTIEGGNFTNNTCEALIEFSALDDVSPSTNLTLLSLLGGNSEANTTTEGESAYDVFITDNKSGDNLTVNRNCIELGGNCDFTSIFINNTQAYIALNVVEDIDINRVYNISVLNSGQYLSQSPIIIVASGVVASEDNFENSIYDFVLSEQASGLKYFYLNNDTQYNFNYVISEDNIVTQKYREGEIIDELSAPQIEGYIFVGWYQESECINEYTFTTMPARDVTVYAKFDILTFTINASSIGSGRISPQGLIEVEYNTSQRFTFIANEGYYVKSITVDGVKLNASELINALLYGYTFENVKESHQIVAEFEILTYTIISSSEGGGNITPSGTNTYNYGQNVTFTVEAYEGYYLQSIVVDGVSLPESVFDQILTEGYTFEDLHNDHTITATFAKQVFTIEASFEGNGQISPNGNVTVEYGNSQKFNFTAENGYHTSAIIVDGVELDGYDLVFASKEGYTFENVTENHTIKVEFKKSNYTITYDMNYECEDFVQHYDYQEEINYIEPLRKGYDFEGWFADEGLINEYQNETMPAENLTLYAKWEIKEYTISANSSSYGKVSSQGDTKALYNSSLTYYFTAFKGYEVYAIYIDDEKLDEQQLADAIENGYTFESIEDNHTLYVQFEIMKFGINLSVEGNGRFYSNQNIDSVNYGDDRLFIIETDYNKYRIEVYVDDQLVSEEERNSILIENIEDDIDIDVKFIKKAFLDTQNGKTTIIVVVSLAAIAIATAVIIRIVRRKRFYSN